MIEKKNLKYNVINDYPSEGVRFIDLTPCLMDNKSFSKIVHKMCLLIKKDYDYIIATEARGFFWGTAISIEKGIGLIPVRKKGKLPPSTVGSTISYGTEYSKDTIEIPNIDLTNKKCLYIDDVYATGGTFEACVNLVNNMGGTLNDGIVVYDVGINYDKRVKSVFKGKDL